jgi:hypothetical protein
LAELVYRDVPVRLAMIPGKVNFDSPKDRQEFDKFETYLVALLESGFITSHGSHSNFAIIDRQKTDSVLNELKFQESGLVDNKDRVKLGNMLGATHLVIMDFSSQIPADNKPEVLITMRLIEIESDKNIATSPLKIKSQQSVDVVQRDLIDYINNKLKRITHLEKDSMAKYNNIRNNLSKQESLDILTNNVIPLYGNFLSELQMINPNTDEVNTIHKLYISGASLQYEGFRALETSIIQKNARQFREANIKLKEGKEKINQFNEAISQLRIKHKVVSKKRDE